MNETQSNNLLVNAMIA